MSFPWRGGNKVHLLENGEAYFPRVFEAIAGAEREVLIETFILFEDKVGKALHELLVKTARRGVRIDLLIDGYGSPDLSPKFIDELTAAGVRLRVFDPRRRILGYRTNLFRRMHRKLVVIDGTIAFVGGINFSADHLADFGPMAKQDYAVELQGPIVDDIHAFAKAAVAPPAQTSWWQRVRPRTAPSPTRDVGDASALFVTRDNDDHRTDIERQYRLAIKLARRELIIANAYFFPGYRLLRDLNAAARRGVRVTLILQGEPDMPIAMTFARFLYHHLLDAGVRIYEYCERPFHGKVALADDEWATVGSSNLDPLSLFLNLEANVFIRDREFNRRLRERMATLMKRYCQPVDPATLPRRASWHSLFSWIVFHLLRRFPSWAGLLPAHTPSLVLVQPGDGAAKKAL